LVKNVSPKLKNNKTIVYFKDMSFKKTALFGFKLLVS